MEKRIKWTGKELKTRLDALTADDWQMVIDELNDCLPTAVERADKTWRGFETILLTAEYKHYQI